MRSLRKWFNIWIFRVRCECVFTLRRQRERDKEICPQNVWDAMPAQFPVKSLQTSATWLDKSVLCFTHGKNIVCNFMLTSVFCLRFFCHRQWMCAFVCVLWKKGKVVTFLLLLLASSLIQTWMVKQAGCCSWIQITCNKFHELSFFYYRRIRYIYDCRTYVYHVVCVFWCWRLPPFSVCECIAKQRHTRMFELKTITAFCGRIYCCSFFAP